MKNRDESEQDFNRNKVGISRPGTMVFSDGYAVKIGSSRGSRPPKTSPEEGGTAYQKEEPLRHEKQEMRNSGGTRPNEREQPRQNNPRNLVQAQNFNRNQVTNADSADLKGYHSPYTRISALLRENQSLKDRLKSAKHTIESLRNAANS